MSKDNSSVIWVALLQISFYINLRSEKKRVENAGLAYVLITTHLAVADVILGFFPTQHFLNFEPQAAKGLCFLRKKSTISNAKHDEAHHFLRLATKKLENIPQFLSSLSQ